MARSVRVVILSLMLGCAGLPSVGIGPANAAQLISQCASTTESGAEKILCEIRADEPKTVYTSVVAKVDDKTIESKFENFAGPNRSTAYLFLIQRTSHPRHAAREAMKLLPKPGTHPSLGVYTFTDHIEERARISANNDADVRQVLQKINPADDRAPAKEFDLDKTTQPALYASVKDALLRLKNFNADRKVLVLFADGKSSGSRSEQDAVVDVAKENKILIAGIGMGGAEGRDLSFVRDLVAKAGGVYVDAERDNNLSTQTNRKGFVVDFFDYFENGGTLKLNGSDVPKNAKINVTATFSDGSTAKSEFVDPRPISSLPSPSPTVTDSPWYSWPKISDWVMDNKPLAMAIAVVGLGLLLLLGALATRGRRRGGTDYPIEHGYGGGDHDGLHAERPGFDGHGATSWQPGSTGLATAMSPASPAMDTVLVGNQAAPSRVYAWLQMLDAASTRIPVGATSVRIGRHKDNDICLNNNTVHRQHAILHMAHDKKFVIRDLGGKNGVKVNDQACNQKELSDGDMIELGEVRMRFALA